MGLFIRRKFSKQTGKLKSLLKLAISRVAIARRPRLARKSIASGDVCQLLALGHIDRAIHRVLTNEPPRMLTWNEPWPMDDTMTVLLMLSSFSTQAEQVIQEDNMLEALGIVETYCKCLIEKAAQLDKPQCVTDQAI
jgi:vacuolar protein sorting-associated protein IST1